MQKLKDEIDALEISLYLAQNNGTILEKDGWTNLPLEIDSLSATIIDRIKNKPIVSLYQNKGNGFRLSWSGKENNQSGNLHFLKMEYILQDWGKKGLFTGEDILENDLIEFYKPFDMLSETMSCGFLITKDFVGKSIYLHNAPYSTLYNLDINFESYIELAKEARIFQYWPKVLLDIKDDKTSPETQNFQSNMPLIFPDFQWEQFVKTYNDNRLSLK